MEQEEISEKQINSALAYIARFIGACLDRGDYIFCYKDRFIEIFYNASELIYAVYFEERCLYFSNKINSENFLEDKDYRHIIFLLKKTDKEIKRGVNYEHRILSGN